MEYKAEVSSLFCSLDTFIINGVKADESDFVYQGDAFPEIADDYACGDMQADVIEPTGDVLKKYSITADEYQTIAEDVAEKLSFGCCGLCQ